MTSTASGGAKDSASSEGHLALDFHFDYLLDNLPGSSDSFINGGFNAMKTLRRSTPNR